MRVMTQHGKVSHYNWQGYQGETAFLELVEHIDRSFRTVGVALLITTAVISSAFLAATFSSMPGISFFGGLACSAMVAALIGDLVFLPALLNWVMGRKERRRRDRMQRRKGLRL